jgi:hypothetical protein
MSLIQHPSAAQLLQAASMDNLGESNPVSSPYLGLYFSLEIMDIDDTTEQVEATGVVKGEFEALEVPDGVYDLEACQPYRDQLLVDCGEFLFYNALQTTVDPTDVSYTVNQGHVRCRVGYTVSKFQQRFYLNRFPFDRQILLFQVGTVQIAAVIRGYSLN